MIGEVLIFLSLSVALHTLTVSVADWTVTFLKLHIVLIGKQNFTVNITIMLISYIPDIFYCHVWFLTIQQ